MQQHVLYAYVDGSDLDDIVADLEEELLALTAASGWFFSRPIVVNQKSGESGSRPGDLPSWDLGINLALPDREQYHNDWFADVERLVACLTSLRSQFGRDSIMGIADKTTGTAEDLFYVESETPDVGRLRSLLAVPGDYH